MPGFQTPYPPRTAIFRQGLLQPEGIRGVGKCRLNRHQTNYFPFICVSIVLASYILRSTILLFWRIVGSPVTLRTTLLGFYEAMKKIFWQRLLPLRSRLKILLKQDSAVIGRHLAFTLIELMVVVALVGIMSAVAIPVYTNFIEKARLTKSIAELAVLEKEILAYKANRESLPDSLADVGRQDLRDPWGNPYQYLNFANVQGKGKMRKDRFLVPLNTDFDLYSMGADGKSQTPLTAKASQDDIIRANNGAYIGPASEY
jgi:general secretion pathway protein G